MDLEEAYSQLGLMPLDEFIQQRIDDNLIDCMTPEDEIRQRYRQIGATTWMCVRICLHLMQKRNAILVSSDFVRTSRIGNIVNQYMVLFGFPGMNPDSSHIVFDGAGILYLGTRGHPLDTRTRGRCLVFDDHLWKQRAVRRSLGPFAMVRTVILSNGQLLGCDDDGVPIIEFTSTGAVDFLESNPSVDRGGFTVANGLVVPLDPPASESQFGRSA